MFALDSSVVASNLMPRVLACDLCLLNPFQKAFQSKPWQHIFWHKSAYLVGKQFKWDLNPSKFLKSSRKFKEHISRNTRSNYLISHRLLQTNIFPFPNRNRFLVWVQCLSWRHEHYSRALVHYSLIMTINKSLLWLLSKRHSTNCFWSIISCSNKCTLLLMQRIKQEEEWRK